MTVFSRSGRRRGTPASLGNLAKSGGRLEGFGFSTPPLSAGRKKKAREEAGPVLGNQTLPIESSKIAASDLIATQAETAAVAPFPA